MGGCRGTEPEKLDVDPTALMTEALTLEPTAGQILDDFDSSYTNLPSTMDSVVQASGCVYFTSGYMLYCFDLETNQKTVLADDIIACNIYLSGDYVYFLREQTLNRIDIKTNLVEEVCTAVGLVKLSLDKSNYEHRDYALKLAKGTQKFVRYQMLGDEDVLIVSYYYIVQEGDSGIDSAYAYSDDLRFNIIDSFDVYKDILTKKGDTPLLQPEKKVIDYAGEGSEEYTQFFGASLSEPKHPIIIEYNDYSTDKAYYLDNIYSVNSVEGSLILSGKNAFSTDVFDNQSYIIKHNIDTYQKEKIKVVNSSKACLRAIGQYIICYYYDRKASDDIDGPFGVILIDTKNNITYENEEINQVISGDIEYTNLMNTDFYLNGDKLYMLENESIEIAMDDLTDEQRAALSEKEIINDYGEYLDPVSKSNLYEAEIVDGKLQFTLLYKEF